MPCLGFRSMSWWWVLVIYSVSLCSSLVLFAKFSLTVHRILRVARLAVGVGAAVTARAWWKADRPAIATGYSVRGPPACRTPDMPTAATKGRVREASYAGVSGVTGSSTPFALQVTVSFRHHYGSSLV